MPIYAFRCRGCGLEFEELVPRMGQIAPCPECGSEDCERRVTAPAVGRKGDRPSGPSCAAAPECGYT